MTNDRKTMLKTTAPLCRFCGMRHWPGQNTCCNSGSSLEVAFVICPYCTGKVRDCGGHYQDHFVNHDSTQCVPDTVQPPPGWRLCEGGNRPIQRPDTEAVLPNDFTRETMAANVKHLADMARGCLTRAEKAEAEVERMRPALNELIEAMWPMVKNREDTSGDAALNRERAVEAMRQGRRALEGGNHG